MSLAPRNWGAFAIVGALAAACNGRLTSEPSDRPGSTPASTPAPDRPGPGPGPGPTPLPSSSDASTPSPPPDDSACTARGGLCLYELDTPGGPPHRVRSKEKLCGADDHDCWLIEAYPEGAACKNDVDCNEDLSTSSVLHRCFGGSCICQAPFHVQSSGKCGQKAPPNCAAQSGTCFQNPATCPPSAHRTALVTDKTCGELAADAVCCIPICKTPVDLVCCDATKTAHEPLCVNWWRTCEGLTPALRSTGCL